MVAPIGQLEPVTLARIRETKKVRMPISGRPCVLDLQGVQSLDSRRALSIIKKQHLLGSVVVSREQKDESLQW